MSKTKNSKNNYDKIFKENLEGMIPALARILFNLTWTKSEKIELKLQYTLEREPDFLRKITTIEDKEIILQVEFQGKDSRKSMLHRLIVYKGLLLKRYGLPVKQFVIYLGNEPSGFETEYEDEDMTFRYHLINLNEIDKDIFLNSDRPEEVIFALLGDFNDESPKSVLHKIFTRLTKLEKDHLDIERYVKQLQMLSFLRNFDEEFNKILRKMPLTIDITKSYLYKEGQKKERKSLTDKFIIELLKLGALNIEQIATVSNMPVDYVLKIKEKRDRSLVENLLKKGGLDIKEIAKELNLEIDFVKNVQREMKK